MNRSAFFLVLSLGATVMSASEFLLDTTRVPEPAGGGTPSIAFDGTNFLVVYIGYDWQTAGIYGARMTQQGRLLDAPAVLLSPDGVGVRACAVASDGANFLLVWEPQATDSLHIYATRVTSALRALDSPPIVVACGQSKKRLPTVAFDGVNYLVAWQNQKDGDTSIYASRISPSGTILDPEGILVCTTACKQTGPSLAFSGTHYLVAWSDWRNGSSDIFCARVDRYGRALDPAGVLVKTGPDRQYAPSVAGGASGFLVAWRDTTSNHRDAYFARVDSVARVLDTGGILLATGWCSSVAAGFDGSNYAVSWVDEYGSNTYAARISLDGTILDPGGVVIDHPSWQSPRWPGALCWGRTDYLVAWGSEECMASSDVWAGRFSADGQVPDTADVLVSNGPSPQHVPAASFDNRNFLVAWQDERGGAHYRWDAVCALRLSPSGTVLDSAPIMVKDSERCRVAEPMVEAVSNGTNHLVIWRHEPAPPSFTLGLLAARVSSAGVLLDSGGIAICSTFNDLGSVGTASDGSDYLIAWTGLRSEIFGVRISASGRLLDTEFIRITTRFGGQSPAAAFGVRHYLVVWERDSGSGSADIYAARVTPAGAVLDPSGIAVTNYWEPELAPAVAFGDSCFLVVWKVRSSDWHEIRGARLDLSGRILDPIGFHICTPETIDYDNLSVGFDGDRFLVSWRELRDPGLYAISGARVAVDGTVVDTGTLFASDRYFEDPDLTVGGDHSLLVYSRPTDYYQGKHFGDYRIWASLDPFHGVEDRRPTPNLGRTALCASPNPFRDRTRFSFSLTEFPYSLRIFDAGGSLVRTLGVPSDARSAQAAIEWDGTNDEGGRLPAGLYFVRLSGATPVLSTRVALLR